MTRRREILERLALLASSITIANGYHSDAGARVYLGASPELGPDDPDAAIAIVPGDDATNERFGQQQTILPVEIHALAKATIAEPWIAVEDLMGDIKAAIEIADRTLGSVLKGDMIRGVTRTLERLPGSDTVGLAIVYVCPYIEPWGVPQYGTPTPIFGPWIAGSAGSWF